MKLCCVVGVDEYVDPRNIWNKWQQGQREKREVVRLVEFYGISTLVGYLMPNPLKTYIKYMFWFGWVGFYRRSTIVGYFLPTPLYIYIYIYDLVGFYGISTLVGYLMPNPLYTYILNIYESVWLDMQDIAGEAEMNS